MYDSSGKYRGGADLADVIICPECGSRVAKGSTHCLHCGTRLDVGERVVSDKSPSRAALKTEKASLDDAETTMMDMLAESEPVTSTPPRKTISAERAEPALDSLPPLDDSLLPQPEETTPASERPAAADTTLERTSGEELMWDVEGDMEDHDAHEIKEVDELPIEERDATVAGEIEPEDVTEGDPFREVEPPIPVDVEDLSELAPPEARDHLFTELEEVPRVEEVAHLFPKGKGTTSREFIDVIVGKPKRIGISEPMKELETPSCPHCGAVLTGDDFEYPGYVYEAMGRARMEHGNELLKKGEHERAIEEFERAKKLYNRAKNEKMVAEASKRVDEGYETMAASHFSEGERHLKEKEFEWAIVQFKKAREIYMFTSLAKMRAKCTDRIKRTYEEWGKALEEEGDRLAKAGDSRRALAKYQEAAEKYREAEAPKRLKGLEKKIRRA
ncbi:MAG: hypothetical protein DRO73_10815 [Candidatus Thorarchaeota archaeon]|nr:MAG: hypothetical protein DRO73_10815 [Candidatus Thorarchaeota archaeon]